MQRNQKSFPKLGAAVLLAVPLSLPVFADDLTINRMLASQCSQCHGTNGYAVGDIDSLAGESVREIQGELREMQSEGSPDDMMDHQALGYTDDQIRRIAEYFAGLPENSATDTPGIRLSVSGASSGGNHDDDDERDEDRDHDQDRGEDRDRSDRYTGDEDRSHDRDTRDKDSSRTRDRDHDEDDEKDEED